MRNIILLTKKNLQILIRSKSSVLIVTFIPLLLILILGLAYNTSEQIGVKIGVATPTTGAAASDTASFITMLEAENFTVIKYSGSVATCIEDIKNSHVHACIELPASFSIEDNTRKEVIFHVDPTRINLVWFIQDAVSQKFDLTSTQISQTLTQNILVTLVETKTMLATEKTNVDSAKSKAEAAKTETETVKSNLASLNFATSSTKYDPETVLAAVKSQLSLVETKIDAAIVSVDQANMTEAQKLATKTLLLDAKKGISGEGITIVVNTTTASPDSNNNSTGPSSETNATTAGNASSASPVVTGSATTLLSTNLTTLISTIVAELETTRTQLQTTGQSVGTSTTTLENTKAALDESITTLNNINTALTTTIDKINSQKVTEAATIASPLLTTIKPVREEGTYLNYLFPALLIIVMMFSSLLLGTTLVMSEKNSPAFVRNFFLPVKKFEFIASIYLTNAVIILIKVFVLLSISLFFQHEQIAKYPYIAIVLFIVGSVFTFLGMLIGYLFTSEETSVLASVSIGSLFLFFSGVVLPLEAMAPFIRSLTTLNPFVIGEKIVREVVFFDAAITSLWFEFALIIGYAVLLFIIIITVEWMLHDYLVHRFLRHHHKAHRHREKESKNDV